MDLRAPESSPQGLRLQFRIENQLRPVSLAVEMGLRGPRLEPQIQDGGPVYCSIGLMRKMVSRLQEQLQQQPQQQQHLQQQLQQHSCGYSHCHSNSYSTRYNGNCSSSHGHTGVNTQRPKKRLGPQPPPPPRQGGEHVTLAKIWGGLNR